MQHSKSLKTWLKDLDRHIDGRIYWNPSAGKYTAALIRQDYSVGNLIEVDSGDAELKEFRRGTWESVWSDLTLKWTSRYTRDLRSYQIINTAARDLLGAAKGQTVSMPWITKNAVAAETIARLEQRHFFPLAMGKFVIDRDRAKQLGLDFDPGDVFKFSHSGLGSSGLSQMVARVMATGGEGHQENVEVEFVEELLVDVDAPTIPEEPNPPCYGLTHPVRYPLIRDAMRDMVTSGIPLKVSFATAVKPSSGTTTRFDVMVANMMYAGPYHTYDWHHTKTMPYSATGLLKAAFPGGFSYAPLGFDLESSIEVSEVSNTDEQWQRMETLALIDHQELAFENGTSAFTVGERLTGGTSGRTAVILSVTVTSGSWVGNDAAGTLVVRDTSLDGHFDAGETITDAITGSASTTSDASGGQIAKDFELVSIKTCALSGSDYQLRHVLRGIAGTTEYDHPAGARVYVLPWAGRLPPVIDIHLITMHTHQPSILMKARTGTGEFGPDTELSYEFGYLCQKPFPPDVVEASRNNTTVTVKFAPATRDAGSRYEDCDAIVADVDSAEGHWMVIETTALGPSPNEWTVIESQDSEGYVTWTYDMGTTSAQEFIIHCVCSGWSSPQVAFEVPSAA